MATGAQIVADGMSWVGARVPYLWGGITRAGADCSGFVKAAMAEVGVTIHGRTTGQQVTEGSPVAIGPPGNPYLYALPGDVIFYGLGNASNAAQHEGIYAGANQLIAEPHTGAVASVGSAFADSSEPLSAIRRFSSDTTTSAGAGSSSGTAAIAGATTATLTSSAGAGLGTSLARMAAELALVAGGASIIVLGAHRAVRRPPA